ncbi:MAG: fumarylacetoacetate hydrolase family protein [Acidobacteria bacterium]|nr:fumarylacetoacetate hydrolase family protein [Acidobacteriota bacterium]
MRICRFERAGTVQFGWVESVSGEETITRALSVFPTSNVARAFVEGERCGVIVKEANLRVPVEPSKIVCVGRNYREHASELGNEVPAEPLIFLKPPSSLLDPGGTIVRPGASARVDFEGELGVVIGRRCRRLQPDEDVRPYLLGYTCLNDVTARDLQKKDGQWTRAKGFDSFCPVGPLISDAPDPWSGVEVQTKVNGELRQQGNTREFIFPLDVAIRHISQIMTLWPGDLIATGTPQGVAPLRAGDIVEVTIEGIGTLRNSVVDGV